MPALNKLYRDYRERAAFYIVYIQEAHPIDDDDTETVEYQDTDDSEEIH